MGANITDRQKEILNRIVEEYVKTAQPVSSKLLEKKSGFDLCPATIRNEMQKLTEAGLIHQPHTSAGRVPTDKGYRLFVNDLLESKKTVSVESHTETKGEWSEKELGDPMRLIHRLTKDLAEFSSALALTYLEDEKFFYKDGWEIVLRNPEFREGEIISSFSKLIKEFEGDVNDLELDSGVNIFIGKENPFRSGREFSTIISKCCFPDKSEGFLAIVGPKRMSYEKNIDSMDSLINLLENF